jgi:toxin ParE1/3/4
MRELLLSPRARSDLDGIWDYTAQIWGLEKAEAYLREINQAFELLRHSPHIAAPYDHIRLGLRRFPSGSHAIFLRSTRDSLKIVRVLHAKMDINAHL